MHPSNVHDLLMYEVPLDTRTSDSPVLTHPSGTSAATRVNAWDGSLYDVTSLNEEDRGEYPPSVSIRGWSADAYTVENAYEIPFVAAQSGLDRNAGGQTNSVTSRPQLYYSAIDGKDQKQCTESTS